MPESFCRTKGEPIVNPIKVVIVDDEPLARENLRDLLSAFPQLAVVGEAGGVDEAVRIIAASEAEAVFLDIQMPGGSGFDLLPLLRRPIQIIFVTAYDRYAIRAFDINAVDYLLKPIERPRLTEAVNRLRSGAQIDRVLPIMTRPLVDSRLSFIDEVLINAGVQSFFMPVSDITAVIAAGDYVKLLVADGREYILRGTIKQWRARLPEKEFVQLDRSLIVNLKHIISWRPYGRKMEISFRDSNRTIMLGRSAALRFQHQDIASLHLKQKSSR